MNSFDLFPLLNENSTLIPYKWTLLFLAKGSVLQSQVLSEGISILIKYQLVLIKEGVDRVT